MAPSLLASIEHAREFRYFGNQNYPVKLTKATISTTPVADGKLIKFNVFAVTDQVIRAGEIVSYFSLDGVEFGTQKCNLSDGVSCPISRGDFVLNFLQVLPVDVTPGSYSLKLELFNQDGLLLTCVAFDYTIPFDSTIEYPEIA